MVALLNPVRLSRRRARTKCALHLHHQSLPLQQFLLLLPLHLLVVGQDSLLRPHLLLLSHPSLSQLPAAAASPWVDWGMR